jgi:hypothetical protein
VSKYICEYEYFLPVCCAGLYIKYLILCSIAFLEIHENSFYVNEIGIIESLEYVPFSSIRDEIRFMQLAGKSNIFLTLFSVKLGL